MRARWEGTPFTAALVERFFDEGWWRAWSVSDRVRELAAAAPSATAYGDAAGPVLFWRDYDRRADELCQRLSERGARPGDAVAVKLPDGPALHVAYLAVERLGGIVVGVPARASERDLGTAARKSRCVGMVADATDELVAAHVDRAAGGQWWVALDREGRDPQVRGAAAAPSSAGAAAPRRPEDVFFVNTTSGTTGRPKAVAHNQQRWLRFAEHAVARGRLTGRDRVLSLVPSPYGFGLWSTHTLPAVLGTPVFQLPSWDPHRALEVIQREQITVVMAVTTQLLMLLDRAGEGGSTLDSVRVVFTGGERVPPERARAFEETTGAAVLQFYGSNEAGGVSATSVDDSPSDRRHTAGRVIDEMEVRLVAGDGTYVDERPGTGQVAVRGPMMCSGYVGEPEAMRSLLREDGWLLLPDLAEIDERGYLTVTGRVSDLIIRGGLNISIPEVEAAVLEHPSVTAAVAVPMSDEVYGERVCAVVTVDDDTALTLPDLVSHLAAQGHAPASWPERLLVVRELPIAVGGKVDRELLARLADGEADAGVVVLTDERR